MLLSWIIFSLTWTGALGFTFGSGVDGVCVEDSPSEGGVRLTSCRPDSPLQQWTWMDGRSLLNVGTRRCLSSVHTEPVRTVSCDFATHLEWWCEDQQLIGLRNGLRLSTEKGKLTLNTGKTLHVGDICLNKPRSRRQNDEDTDEFDFEEGPPAQRMTQEQMKFLQWYYRTEDPTSWKFGMLAFSFLGLLIGAMLIVMGMMANRNRKKIAKYKAATQVTAVKADMEELQVIVTEKKEENNCPPPSEHATTHNGHRDWEEPSADTRISEELKPGEIMVTWKDGNVSTLYPEPAAEGQVEVEEDVLNTDDERLSQNSPQVITSSETIAF